MIIKLCGTNREESRSVNAPNNFFLFLVILGYITYGIRDEGYNTWNLRARPI
jgi:hypothetical protein